MVDTPLFDSEDQLEIGQPAPTFSLPGVDGKTYSLEDYRGKVKAMLVIFSCNHCPWVIKYEDRMFEIGEMYRDKGLGYVAINVNDTVRYPQDSFKEMKKRAESKGYPFPYLFDESQQSARSFGAKTTPHVFLFDSDFILRFRGAIDDNPNLENRPIINYLRDAIEALLRGEPSRITNPKTRQVGCSIKWKE